VRKEEAGIFGGMPFLRPCHENNKKKRHRARMNDALTRKPVETTVEMKKR